LVRTSTAEKLVFSAVKIGYVRSSEFRTADDRSGSSSDHASNALCQLPLAADMLANAM
jgi:hypothetical protein